MSKDLIKKILEASNHIHKASIKGSANFIVTTSQTAKSFTNIFLNNQRIQKCKKILDKIKNGKTN